MSAPHSTVSDQTIYLMNAQRTSARLCRRLRACGFALESWPGRDQAVLSVPKLYDLIQTGRDALRLDPTSLNIIFSGGQAAPAIQHADIVLDDIRQAETLASRLNLLRRERRQQRERDLRQETLERVLPKSHRSASLAPRRMLWLGPEARFLNPLKTLLAAHKIELWAAISAFTARDYLETQAFDVIGLYPKRVDDEPMRLLQHLMTLPQPLAWRKVLVLEPETNQIVAGHSADAADVIIDTSTDLDLLTAKIADLAHGQATTVIPQTSPSDATKPVLNTLATRDYLETHVRAQMQESDESHEPLTLVALRVEHAHQIESLIATTLPLLRESDLAARIETKILALSLPGTNFRGGSNLVKRLQATLGFTVEARIIQKRDYHNPKTIIGGLTAMAGLRRRSVGQT